MALGTDTVQIIKTETAALGGDAGDQVAWNYDPLNPIEDAPEVCGVILCDASSRDRLVYVARSGNDEIFKDVTNTTELTLSQLRHGTATTTFRRSFLLMGG